MDARDQWLVKDYTRQLFHGPQFNIVDESDPDLEVLKIVCRAPGPNPVLKLHFSVKSSAVRFEYWLDGKRGGEVFRITQRGGTATILESKWGVVWSARLYSIMKQHRGR